MERITAKHLQGLLSLRDKIESKNPGEEPGVKIHGEGDVEKNCTRA